LSFWRRGREEGRRGNVTFGCMDASMAESTNAGGSCEKKVERQKAPACGLPALLRHASVGSRAARLWRQPQGEGGNKAERGKTRFGKYASVRGN
jgi:hypothetical protein